MVIPYRTRKKHKLSQYANYTNFFVLTEESITEILQFLKKYEVATFLYIYKKKKVATGATINIPKTTILPLAGAEIYNLDKKN